MAQRILRGAPATLVYEHLDADGVAVDATGAMTVEVTTAGGTVIVEAGEPTDHSDDEDEVGRYTLNVLADETAQLDTLIATWTDDDAPEAARSTEHHIVGGFIFTIGEALAFEAGVLAGFDTATLVAKRTEVEDEAERICAVSFVPRFGRFVLDGTGEGALVVPANFIRTVRSVRVYTPTGSTTYTGFTDTQLGALVWSDDGQVRRADFGIFDAGLGNVVVEVEYGHTGPGVPPIGTDLKTAALIRLRDILQRETSGISERTSSFESPDGQRMNLDEGDDEWSTGIDAVDRVYRRYSRRTRPGGKAAPASRPMNFDPQYSGLYRGGIR